MSVAITRGVRVEVTPEFLPDQSEPERGLWVHAYHVAVTNQGEQPVRLLGRHWIITNAHGTEEHVRGPGVVGQQPVIAPGETFRYSSGAPLDTAFGAMHGSYQLVTPEGERFDSEVAPFDLAEPYALN